MSSRKELADFAGSFLFPRSFSSPIDELVQTSIATALFAYAAGDAFGVQYEFKDGLNHYLSTANAKVKSLKEVIDFNLANESIDLAQDIQPEELKSALHEKIYRLIQYKFAEYLNLLYIVDVPEDQIKKLDGSDIAELSKQVAFLVLKREWMKVWFRNKY